LGLTVDNIAKSMTTATSSSRFTQPNYWRDPVSGVAYQVQVEYPQYLVDRPEDIEMVPVASSADRKIYLRDVATWNRITTPAEYDRLNQQRFITLTANIHDKDLGSAVQELDKAIAGLGELPAGVKILKRGQTDLLAQTIGELQLGLLIAVIVIFLMLAASFQSFRISLATISILPAVVGGSVLLLLLTGHSLNIQSYMGAIMALGVAVANSILYVTNAEDLRRQGNENAAFAASANRLRPILMTSFAMIAGMLPMSMGFGEGGDQVAPLGVAVIGGLLFSMFSTLVFLPLIYRSLVGKRRFVSVSLDPNDKQSKYFEKN
jgi:multidrug efflux pump subunit AcrB